MKLHISKRKLKIQGKKLPVVLEEYTDLCELTPHVRAQLILEIHYLLTNTWGTFPDDFVETHIFRAEKLHVVRIDTKCVGICVMSIKNVGGLKIHYAEFLAIDKNYQNSSLGSFVFFVSIKTEIYKNLGSLLLGKPLEIFFITPNIRVLSRMARFSSFIYPNPYAANIEGAIKQADDKTWEIANSILRESDNPGRTLDREGLILWDSYKHTPWLIYDTTSAPWHYRDDINLFAKRYLGYHRNEDREFMVRAHLNIFSIIRYIWYSTWHIFSQ